MLSGILADAVMVLHALTGDSHITGPAEWQKKIATGEFKNIGIKSV